MNEPTVAELERELASFAVENARQRVPIPLPPVPVVTTETVELKGEGELSPPAEIPITPPGGPLPQPELPPFPADAGEYILRLRIESGTPGLAWVGPAAASGVEVIGSNNGDIAFLDTTEC